MSSAFFLGQAQGWWKTKTSQWPGREHFCLFHFSFAFWIRKAPLTPWHFQFHTKLPLVPLPSVHTSSYPPTTSSKSHFNSKLTLCDIGHLCMCRSNLIGQTSYSYFSWFFIQFPNNHWNLSIYLQYWERILMKILCIIFHQIVFLSHLVCISKDKKTQPNKTILKNPQNSPECVAFSITRAISLSQEMR